MKEIDFIDMLGLRNIESIPKFDKIKEIEKMQDSFRELLSSIQDEYESKDIPPNFYFATVLHSLFGMSAEFISMYVKDEDQTTVLESFKRGLINALRFYNKQRDNDEE